jgi:hypothetical protein
LARGALGPGGPDSRRPDLPRGELEARPSPEPGRCMNGGRSACADPATRRSPAQGGGVSCSWPGSTARSLVRPREHRFPQRRSLAACSSRTASIGSPRGDFAGVTSSGGFRWGCGSADTIRPLVHRWFGLAPGRVGSSSYPGVVGDNAKPGPGMAASKDRQFGDGTGVRLSRISRRATAGVWHPGPNRPPVSVLWERLGSSSLPARGR